jgi:hypothetical protein
MNAKNSLCLQSIGVRFTQGLGGSSSMTEYPSPHPDVPVRGVSITERLFEGLEQAGSRTILIDGPSGLSYTGTALQDRIRRLAGGLAA